MVEGKYTDVLEQILDLMETACQASLELLNRYTCGDLETAWTLLTDLRAVTQAISAAQEPLLPQLEHAYTAEMLENVQDTLDDIQQSVEKNNSERAAMKMEFQLFPFLRQLQETFYFWGLIYPDLPEMERYYREEFAEHYQNFYLDGEHTPQYQACVVVVAYNHLAMTKRCVESIIKYTDFDKLNAELVLVDHGSTDGVLEYFEGLGIGRVIHYKANMRGTMFCALPQICNSKYYVHVANDTVVTKDWLDILLRCAESDPNIALAVPATCNLSNCQAVNVPVSDCDALVKLAESKNISNPKLWNDRVRALPAIGMFRIETLNKIGFWDPLFYTFDFMDDDFSLRARRSGYRQILCDDVICYHQGSATVKDVQTKEDTLGEGRRLFQQKHGVDAWETGFCYDFQVLQQFQFSKQMKAANILGIDCGFGDTILQMQNQLRHNGIASKLYHITADERYLPDLRPHSQGVIFASRTELLSSMECSFPDVLFDYVLIGDDLANYPDSYAVLEMLSHKMAPGGELVFSFSNPYFAVRLHQMLQFSIPDSPICLLHPEQVRTEAGKYFSKVSLTGAMQQIQGLDEFVTHHYGKAFLKSTQKRKLEISQYYVKCVK